MLTERTTTLFVSIFYFQKCQTRDFNLTVLYIAGPGKAIDLRQIITIPIQFWRPSPHLLKPLR